MPKLYEKNNPSYKHGMTDTPTYRSWAAMLTRCTNDKLPQYKDYGGRGVTVCERWFDFCHFYADMGVRPDGKSLDRIDNDKGYSPDNCRWATRTEQNKNSRHNVHLEYDGKRMLLSEWADALGIGRTTLTKRVQAGWVGADLFRPASNLPRSNQVSA